jgi:hypothetical protein
MCFHAGLLPALFFNPEDGGDMGLRNIEHITWDYIPDNITLHTSFDINTD